MNENAKWNYPVIGKGSRLGVHAIRPNQVAEFAQDLVESGTRFPVIKAVDDLGWLSGVKEVSPETIVLARLHGDWEGCGGVEKPEFNMDGHARRAIGVILDKIGTDHGLRDAVDYWEVYNEPDPPGVEGYRRLAELMITTIDLAEQHGLKIAIFALNAGTPEWDEMQAMVATGVFGRAKEGGHILTLHEGTFQSHDAKKWWGDKIPGSPQVAGAGALNFRYRYLYHLLQERGEIIPLVVSEWYCGDEASASDQTLIDALTWYDGEASKDYFFWAACPFTLGPTGQWRHTDYERVYPGLVEHMIATRDRQNALPPGPPPAEAPSDEEPLRPARVGVVGVHAAPVLSPPENMDFWLGELAAMGVKWLKMLDNGDPRNVEWARRLVEAGITPIVRLFEAHQFPGRLPAELIGRIPTFVNVGARYFEIANEPNLTVEWKSGWEDRVDYHDSALVAAVASDWWADAKEAIELGGKPAFPAMAPTERGGTNPRYSSVEWFRRVLRHVAANHGLELQQHLRDGTIWIATHTSPFNRPFDYDPNRGTFEDDMCLRGYEVFRDFVKRELDVEPVVISTEGGCYSPSHLEDLGWSSPYGEQEWGTSTAQTYDWLAQNSDLTAMCTWTLSDAGVSDQRWLGCGWYDKNDNPRAPVAAMKQRAQA